MTDPNAEESTSGRSSQKETDEHKKSVLFGSISSSNTPKELVKNIRAPPSKGRKLTLDSETLRNLSHVIEETEGPIPHWDKFVNDSIVEFRQNWDKKTSSIGLSIYDFDLLTVISKIKAGVVVIAESNFGLGHFALKILFKDRLVATKQVDAILSEKRIMTNVKCPFLVRCYFFFQDNSYLYFVMPLLSGGDASTEVLRSGKFPEATAAFIAAQVVLALEYMHRLNLVHRDVKPENILLDAKGFIKLTGFRITKLLTDSKTYTICGTSEYMAPELLLGQGYGKSVDWWALGVTIYELCAGRQPFSHDDKTKMFRAICKGKYKNLSEFSKKLKNLLQHLLVVDVSRRYGLLAGGVSDLKTHQWFDSIKWDHLANRDCNPPYVPQVSSPTDVRYFSEYQDQTVLLISKTNTFNDAFADF